MNKSRVIAVIPARYGSTRFPGKPLADIAGKPMIQRVYECAAACKTVDQVLVATDDERILERVAAFGGQAVMTSSEHTTGTDRIAEAVAGMEGDIILNLQGDEPLMPADVIDALIERLQNSEAEMGTVAVPFGLTDRDPADENAVKVVVDDDGYALYFSRALIPFHRKGGMAAAPLWHWGVYAYRRDFLEKFVTWPVGKLEACEMLEQLRALENGARILVIQASSQTLGVDLPEDVKKVEQILKQREAL